MFVQEFADVTACEAYELMPLQVGNYYLSPGGVDLIPVGTLITATTTIYIYAENDFNCSDESVFIVTINQVPQLNQPQPLYACDENADGFEFFDLNELISQISEGVEGNFSYSFHQTQIDAELGVNAIVNTQNYVNIIYFSQTYNHTTDLNIRHLNGISGY